MAQVDPARQVMSVKLPVDRIILIPLDADPTDIEDGTIWYSVISSTHHLKLRKAGSTVNLS